MFLSELAEDAPGFEDIQMETADLARMHTDQQAVDVAHPSIETPQEPDDGSEIDVEPAPEAPPVLDGGGEVPFPMADDEREPVEAASEYTSDQMESEAIPDDGFSDEPAIEAEHEAEAPMAEPEIDLIEDAPPAPTEAAPEGESEPEPDEPSKTPKRFNPWI